MASVLPVTIVLLSLCASACGSMAPNGSTRSDGGMVDSGRSSRGSKTSDAGKKNDAGTDSGPGGSANGQDAGGDGSVTHECAAMPNSLLCDPMGKMPKSIKDTGLFPAAPDLTTHSPRMIEYVPDPPLWSDGMEKQRFILLPLGKKIDNSDRTKWAFPAGTICIKTFFDDGGPGGKPRAIETRLIRAGTDAYEFYLYQWNSEGTDATLTVDDLEGDPNKDVPVMITIKREVAGRPFMVNNGRPFAHTLPSWQACSDCHEQNGMVRQTFIGFDEIRLNSKRTEISGKTQLQDLSEAGVFTTPAPADPETITDNTTNDGGRLLRIKRFIFGNCVHCHYNGLSQFDMSPDVFVENTVGKPTEAQSVSPPRGWLRVVPRNPANSVLYVQFQRTMLPVAMGASDRLRPMPPVGTADVAVDQAALSDIRAWIMSLPLR